MRNTHGGFNTFQVENESGRLSQQDIERMLNDAEQYKQEDTLTREENIARESLKGCSRMRLSGLCHGCTLGLPPEGHKTSSTLPRPARTHPYVQFVK